MGDGIADKHDLRGVGPRLVELKDGLMPLHPIIDAVITVVGHRGDGAVELLGRGIWDDLRQHGPHPLGPVKGGGLDRTPLRQGDRSQVDPGREIRITAIQRVAQERLPLRLE